MSFGIEFCDCTSRANYFARGEYIRDAWTVSSDEPMRKILTVLAAVVVWSVFLWRGLDAFGPASDINDVGFNSDSAIPVLMANDERRISVFNCYYYGADRWGAWPFLFAQLTGRAFGHRWTPETLSAFQTVWVFLGVWAFASLNRCEPIVAGLAYLLVLCLHREGRYLLFEMSQIYAWQVTALLLAWASLRRLFESFGTAQQYHLGRQSAWLLTTAGVSFLATWSSVASTVFLAFLLVLEALRARSKARTSWLHRQIVAPAMLGLAAIAAANVLERVLKMSYRSYSAEHYDDSFTTVFGFDTAYVGENLARQWQHLAKLTWWPLYVLPSLAVLALAGVVLYAILAKKESLREQATALFARDLVILALGAYTIAAINLALAVVVDHVRLNGYDDRYLTLTNLFAPVSGILLLFILVTDVTRSSRLGAYAQAIFVVGALGLLIVKFPVAQDSREYRLLAETASTLAERAPGGILMGSYWDTYVFIALQPSNTMIPVPFEGHSFRTPWTPRALRRAEQVIVGHPRGVMPSEMSSSEGLDQYGVLFRLVDPHWYENERYTFALYAR
jgi:hypothetical protein